MNNQTKLSEKIHEDAIKLRKPVIFWAALSFFYVEGNIHLNLVATDNGLGIQTPWGVPIIGMTEEKFLTALAIILGYFWFRLVGLGFLALRSHALEEQAPKSRSYPTPKKDTADGHHVPNLQLTPPKKRKSLYNLSDHSYEDSLGWISWLLYAFVPIFLPILVGEYSFLLLLLKLWLPS